MLAIRRRTVALSWPIAIQQLSNTLMRTTDIVIAAMISPVAVAAIGLADHHALLSFRFGSGLGGGAIALSSQNTGRGATETRVPFVARITGLLGSLLGVSSLASVVPDVGVPDRYDGIFAPYGW